MFSHFTIHLGIPFMVVASSHLVSLLLCAYFCDENCFCFSNNVQVYSGNLKQLTSKGRTRFTLMIVNLFNKLLLSDCSRWFAEKHNLQLGTFITWKRNIIIIFNYTVPNTSTVAVKPLEATFTLDPCPPFISFIIIFLANFADIFRRSASGRTSWAIDLRHSLFNVLAISFHVATLDHTRTNVCEVMILLDPRPTTSNNCRFIARLDLGIGHDNCQRIRKHFDTRQDVQNWMHMLVVPFRRFHLPINENGTISNDGHNRINTYRFIWPACESQTLCPRLAKYMFHS